jgi:hypothetical protein
MFLMMTRMEIIYRPAQSNLRLRRLMTGLYTSWVVFLDRWVIELRSTRLRRVKIHKITPATGDLELKDDVVLQKPQEQTDRLSPPRTLIMDFTWTHTRFGRSNLHPIGQLMQTRRSDGASEPDGALKTVVRTTIIHYRQVYLNRQDPIAFMRVAVDTSGRIYDDFSRLLFLHAHREASALANEESG